LNIADGSAEGAKCNSQGPSEATPLDHVTQNSLSAEGAKMDSHIARLQRSDISGFVTWAVGPGCYISRLWRFQAQERNQMTFAICLDNEGYEASLELRKIYQVAPPSQTIRVDIFASSTNPAKTICT
jgi:hypothetical protein